MSDHDARVWDIEEEVGAEALLALVTDLYDRLYDDLLVGFFFLPFPKQRLIDHQLEYVRARLGPPGARYTGQSMLTAHERHPILPAHFDRRHVVLTEVLSDHGIPAHVRDAWLALDLSLRPLIVRKGAERREDMLKS